MVHKLLYTHTTPSLAIYAYYSIKPMKSQRFTRMRVYTALNAYTVCLFYIQRIHGWVVLLLNTQLKWALKKINSPYVFTVKAV